MQIVVLILIGSLVWFLIPKSDVHLVSGPVIYHKKNSFFQKLQCLEFISLVASAAGSVGINNAIFCNGANMAYRKKSFLKLNDFNESLSLVETMFFYFIVLSLKIINLSFCKEKNAIAATDGQPSLSSFINQRKRWASKIHFIKTLPPHMYPI